ncbi:MAG: hypothetical protein II397_08860, partial [Treponema sp.]|nr:hypothetical protein [Treponema sp.]
SPNARAGEQSHSPVFLPGLPEKHVCPPNLSPVRKMSLLSIAEITLFFQTCTEIHKKQKWKLIWGS